jgi:hypothetical protein
MRATNSVPSLKMDSSSSTLLVALLVSCSYLFLTHKSNKQKPTLCVWTHHNYLVSFKISFNKLNCKTRVLLSHTS